MIYTESKSIKATKNKMAMDERIAKKTNTVYPNKNARYAQSGLQYNNDRIIY